MESIVRNVRDIEITDRHALEHVVGRSLRDDQRLIIQLTEIDEATSGQASIASPPQALPDWCKVYDGVTNDEILEIEQIALQPVRFGRTSD